MCDSKKNEMKEYKTIVWTDDGTAGKRIILLADTLEEAKQKLLIDYGPKATISLWDEDDANHPRVSK
jgi:hypothetical protein